MTSDPFLRAIVLTAALLALSPLFAGCSKPSANTQPPNDPPEGETPAVQPAPERVRAILTPTADQLTAGKAAYEKGMCSKCHGDAGKGGDRAPDLTDREWLHCDGTIESILEVLHTGVPREKLVDQSRRFAMNPVTRLVPDEDELAAFAAYVRSLSVD